MPTKKTVEARASAIEQATEWRLLQSPHVQEIIARTRADERRKWQQALAKKETAKKIAYEKGKAEMLSINIKDTTAAYAQGQCSRYGECAHCKKTTNLIGICTRCLVSQKEQGRKEMADEIEKRIKENLKEIQEYGYLDHIVYRSTSVRPAIKEAISAARKVKR